LKAAVLRAVETGRGRLVEAHAVQRTPQGRRPGLNWLPPRAKVGPRWG
jgi:hypothetical protein